LILSACSFSWWLVLICSERKVLLAVVAGGWFVLRENYYWLVASWWWLVCFEHGGGGAASERYSTLALELAKHNIRAGDGKLLHLTATAHCRFPDDRVKEALDTGIFERIHVRFYDDDADCAAGFSAAKLRDMCFCLTAESPCQPKIRYLGPEICSY
jgi:hypothetical protein